MAAWFTAAVAAKIALFKAVGFEGGGRVALLAQLTFLQPVFVCLSQKKSTSVFDEYVPAQNWKNVHVLKINAEGYDMEIYRGRRKLLDAGRIHLIFTEINFQQLYQGWGDFLALDRFLSECGYSLVGFNEADSSPTG